MSARRELLTAPEAALELELDARTVRRWIEAGRIAGEKIGRRYWTTRASVDAFRATLMPARRSGVRAVA